MLGLLYIILNIALGYVLCTICIPSLGRITDKTYSGRQLSLSSCFVTLPAWYVIGTLIMTWLVYIVACVVRNSADPLFRANLIVMIFAIIIIMAGLLWIGRKGRISRNFGRITNKEIILFAVLTCIAISLMFVTLYESGDELKVGVTVFSDFSPHLSMIRSFSYGNNFPTQYPFFAGADVKYHFMFQFLAGNLEYLGMKLSLAFNIPSILGLLGVYSVLYALAVKLTGRRLAGALSCVFFSFRSSPSLFTFLASIPKEKGIIKALGENIDYIGYTPNENWGLWNLNVYCNQRHLAFGLIVMLLIIMSFLPLLFEMWERVFSRNTITGSDEGKRRNSITGVFTGWFRASILDKKGWIPHNYMSSVFFGVILGAVAFWNGAVLIGTVSVLFVLAIFSDRRLEYLITAVIAGGLTLLQSGIFIDGKAVSPKLLFGFLAENKTFFGVIEYMLKLMGILPIIVLIVFIISKGVERLLIFAFSAPLILAFTISLTPDVNVNHKYVIMSVMLYGIFAAEFIMKIIARRKFAYIISAFILIICLTGTGVFDYYTVLHRNTMEGGELSLNLKSELTEWVRENTDSKDIFLTANYHLGNVGSGSDVILGGGMLYDGWQYFSWSAGYDTMYRDSIVKRIYDASGKKSLLALVKKENIDYIIVDYNNRISADYNLNEALISESFEKAYERGTGDNRLTIYKTGIR